MRTLRKTIPSLRDIRCQRLRQKQMLETFLIYENSFTNMLRITGTPRGLYCVLWIVLVCKTANSDPSKENKCIIKRATTTITKQQLKY